MERYREASEQYERLVALTQKTVTNEFDALDAERIDWLVANYIHARLAHDDETRFDRDDARFELEALSSFRSAPMGFMDGASRREKAVAGLPIVIKSLKNAYGNGDLDSIIQIEGQNALDLAGEHALHISPDMPRFGEFCRKLLVADIAVAERLLARFHGEPSATPRPPEAPPTVFPAAAHKARSSFDSIVKEEMKRPTFTGGASTKQSWNTALRYFREVHGELAPEEITRRHVSHLADLLALAPTKAASKKAERGWTLPKLVEAYEGKEVERLSWKTRAAMLGALQAAWNRGQRSGSIDPDLLNPFARPNLGKAPSPRKNDGFTRDESRTIFSLPVFTAGDRPSGGRGEARYWLPILLLTTGARPEELAQALAADVRHDADAGEWTLSITAQGPHPHKGQRALKTPSAERIISLPSVLIDLGLADYLEWLAGRGELAMFPALRTKGERGELWPSFGEWWASYLRENGARPDGKRPAREFRPTWATIARESGVSREAQEYLMGHAPDASDMNARYGSRESLRREMRKLSFDGWGLEKVRTWCRPSE